jgi:hypothetical protein
VDLIASGLGTSSTVQVFACVILRRWRLSLDFFALITRLLGWLFVLPALLLLPAAGSPSSSFWPCEIIGLLGVVVICHDPGVFDQLIFIIAGALLGAAVKRAALCGGLGFVMALVGLRIGGFVGGALLGLVLGACLCTGGRALAVFWSHGFAVRQKPNLLAEVLVSTVAGATVGTVGGAVGALFDPSLITVIRVTMTAVAAASVVPFFE